MIRPRDPALIHLASTDPVMARLIALHGPPSLRPTQADPFHALARAIVFQQLTGRAAATILTRLQGIFGGQLPEPLVLLEAHEDSLRSAGLSRQKVAALRSLATHAAQGELSRAELAGLEDEDAIAHLTRIRGVGRWTAEMYLIDCGRPDVLPVSDLGLNKAMKRLYALDELPGPATIRDLGAAWRPYASTACWYLWRSYDTPVPTWLPLEPPRRSVPPEVWVGAG